MLKIIWIPLVALSFNCLLNAVEVDERSNFPVMACPVNQVTVDMVKRVQPKVYAEVGIAVGSTTLAVAEILPADSEMYLFDFYDKVESVTAKLSKKGFTRVKGYGNSYKLRDSYNWSLMKLLSENTEPIFDYVFLDGMHTWDIEGFSFLLVDKLLKPGGYVDFDDYDWTLKGSPTLAPHLFPLTSKLYTNEQIKTKQIKLVVDLLVKRNKDYVEILPNKIYQKRPLSCVCSALPE